MVENNYSDFQQPRAVVMNGHIIKDLYSVAVFCFAYGYLNSPLLETA